MRIMSVSRYFVLFGLCTAWFHQTGAQKLTFPSVLTHDKKPNQVGNWSVEGIVKLTEADVIMFEQLLEVQTYSKMCTIDLTTCGSEADTLPLSNTCYCTKASNEEFNVHIGATDKQEQNGRMLQAIVPSRAAYRPITATSVIGKMPTVENAHMTFTKRPQVVVSSSPSMNQLANRIHELEKNDKLVESKLDNIENSTRTSMSEILNHLRELEKQKESAKIELSHMKYAVTRLEKEKLTTNSELSHMQKSVAKLEKEKESEKTELSQMNNSYIRLQKETESTSTELSKVKGSLSSLEKEKESAKTELFKIKIAVTRLDNENDARKAENVQILKDLAALQSRVKQNALPRHIETGSSVCLNSSSWTKTDYINQRITIKFKKPYKNPPLVMRAIDLLDIDHTKNTRTHVLIENVDENGFTAICQTWADTFVYKFGFNWLSISTDE